MFLNFLPHFLLFCCQAIGLLSTILYCHNVFGYLSLRLVAQKTVRECTAKIYVTYSSLLTSHLLEMLQVHHPIL
jgi:hypothetical protein